MWSIFQQIFPKDFFRNLGFPTPNNCLFHVFCEKCTLSEGASTLNPMKYAFIIILKMFIFLRQIFEFFNFFGILWSSLPWDPSETVVRAYSLTPHPTQKQISGYVTAMCSYAKLKLWIIEFRSAKNQSVHIQSAFGTR